MRRMRTLSSLHLAIVLAGSTARAVPAAAPVRKDTTPAASRGVRLIPPLDGPEVVTLGVESDGTRRVVAYGLRLLVRADGSIETASEYFPVARNVNAVELPQRLGEGFLFSVVASERTALWRAPTWTGPLEPFAELDFELERFVPGFDRLYVQARRTGDWAALDVGTGKAIQLGNLPPSPGYGAMVFVDEWFGAVELPVRGTAVTFDAGNHWQRLGTPTLGLGRLGNELLLVTPEGRRALASDGSQRPVESGGDAARETEPQRRVLPEGLLGAFPLRSAVLRGFPESSDTAIVIVQGTLARVRLSDGRVLARRKNVLSESSVCVSVRLGPGHGFACSEPQGKTEIVAFEPPFALRTVERFDTPRVISESGNGGLVIRGRCSGKAADAVRSAHCVRSPDGTRWELLPILQDAGVERVIALRDGRAALLAPPRPGAQGALVLAKSDGHTHSVPLKLTGRDAAAETLLKKGFWLDGFTEASDGTLRGWVVGQAAFAGVRVELDGKVRVGPLQRSIERALISGERALIVPSAGIAEQTTDTGQTFTDADLPVEMEPDASKAQAAGATLEQGCSRVGCAFMGWLRVGWNDRTGSRPLAVAARPSPTSPPNPGGGRWLLRCSPAGDASPKPAQPVARRTHVEPAREDGQASWLPLAEHAPPSIPPYATGFDTGSEQQFRAYAWAPRGTEFGKAGQLVVRAVDKFRVRGGVWSTSPSPSPWTDVVQVAEVFGYEGSSPSLWNLTLDSSGSAGVLSVTARGSTELFAVEEGRGTQLLVNASRHGIGTVTSAVRVGNSYYVSAQEDARSFRVFALESGRARMVGQYAEVALGRSMLPVLVRSTRNDALAIWGRGSGWFVYPLDPSSGAVERPITISASTLARMPQPCAPDEEGFLLEGSVGIDPYADFVDGADDVVARGFEGRFIVSPRGICLSELAARAENAVEPALRPAPKQSRSPAASVPLVLTDRAEEGRRWAFRCSH